MCRKLGLTFNTWSEQGSTVQKWFFVEVIESHRLLSLQWINSLMGGFHRLSGDNGNLGGRTQLKQWTIKVVA